MSAFQAIDPMTAGLVFNQPQWRPALENAPLSRPAATFAAIEAGVVRALYSLWDHAGLAVCNPPIVCAGHLYAEDPLWAARALTDLLERAGGPVLAPMDGSTWHPYRVMLDQRTERPFFLEKPTAPFWPEAFERAGFSLDTRYRSSVTETLDYADRAADVWAAKIATSGIDIRPFDLSDAQSELRALHSLSLESFARNRYYTPVSEVDFLSMYTPVLPALVPDFVRMAWEGDRLVGFVFALPDLAQKARGQAIDTLIVKTLAVRPGRAYAGLGSYLAKQVHLAAKAAGFRRAIHAYMFDGNASRVISDKSAHTLRTYGLYIHS